MSEQIVLKSLASRLPAEIGTKFSTINDLSSWLAQEEDFWAWLQEASPNGYRQFCDEFAYSLRTSRQMLQQFIAEPTNQNALTVLQRSLSRLNDQISSGKYIPSSSRLAAMITKLKKASKSRAFDVCYVSTRADDETLPNNKRFSVAAGILAAHDLGISRDSAESSALIVQKASRDFDELLGASRKMLAEQSNLVKVTIDKIETRGKSIGKLIVSSLHSKRRDLVAFKKAILDETKAENDDLLRDTRLKIDEFRTFMESEIALQVPAKYWLDKKNWHLWGTIVSGMAFVIYCAGVTVFSYCEVKSVYGGLAKFLEHWRNASLSVFGAMAGIAAIAMVFARVMYRMFASQLHLWNDASERVTMIHTYLALAEKGHAKEEFLGALMNRLFSPASDGVVRDDLGAIGPLDLATRLGGKS